MTKPRSQPRETNPGDGDARLTPADQQRSKAWLEEDSDALLAAVDDLRRLELEKREEPISSDGFHTRAIEIEHRSRLIFGLAHEQEQVGQTFGGTQDESIDDVARDRDDGATGPGGPSEPEGEARSRPNHDREHGPG
jgi:hypothetical protein